MDNGQESMEVINNGQASKQAKKKKKLLLKMDRKAWKLLRNEAKADAKEEAVHMQTAPSRPRTTTLQILKDEMSKKRQRCSIENHGSTAASEEKMIPREPFRGRSERQEEYDHDRAVQILKDHGGRGNPYIFPRKRPETEIIIHKDLVADKERYKINLFQFEKAQFMKVMLMTKAKDNITEEYGKKSSKEKILLPELLLAQRQRRSERARCRRIRTGQETVLLPRSNYKEDMFINYHTTVWGSWWKDHQWGYNCCKQMVRNSYCTGAAGMAAEAATDLVRANVASKEITEDKPAPPVERTKGLLLGELIAR